MEITTKTPPKTTIDPNRPLAPAEDYFGLRDTAFTAIEQLGHRYWTDYNAHDPGMTLTENLCYALADIGYRGQFDVADLLTGPGGGIDHRQPFFTARNILTNAPLTDDDFRRLLIDDLGLSNAWLVPKVLPCGPLLYSDCELARLRFAPPWRTRPDGLPPQGNVPTVTTRGFTDVFLQFAPTESGENYNSHRLDISLAYPLAEGGVFSLPGALRFPDWERFSPHAFRQLADPKTELKGVRLLSFSRSMGLDEEADTDDLRRGVHQLFYLDYLMTFTTPAGEVVLQLTDVTLRLLVTDRKVIGQLLVETIRKELADPDIARRYLAKLQGRAAALKKATQLLHRNRKVGEDYCRCAFIKAEEVSVCANIHLEDKADVEAVLASFYRRLEELLNPQVPFRALGEMEALGKTPGQIFNGPRLRQGFITDEDLVAARLRKEIFVSDLINELLDLDGIVTIEGLHFTVYDAYGHPRPGHYDWSLPISPGHYPELYVAASAVCAFKNGFPFRKRPAEFRAILNQLRAQDRAVALPTRELDYPVPTGTHRPAPDYLPVQRTLPATYGLSGAGVPVSGDEGQDRLRTAQARQLAGFLLPLEVITAATSEQLTRFADLFSTDDSISKTYVSPDLLGRVAPLAEQADLWRELPVAELADWLNADELATLADLTGKTTTELGSLPPATRLTELVVALDPANELPHPTEGTEWTHSHELVGGLEQLRQTIATGEPPLPTLDPARVERLIELLRAANQAFRQALLEPAELALDRRNRLLDHLLARFGERMEDYTLLFHNRKTMAPKGPAKQLEDKARFLKFYPEISARRGGAFNYRHPGTEVDTYTNRSGLGERLRRLMGLEDLRANVRLTTTKATDGFRTSFELVDADGAALLTSPVPAAAPHAFSTAYPTAEEAERMAWAMIGQVVEKVASGAINNRRVTAVTVENPQKKVLLAVLAAGVTKATATKFLAERLDRERLYVVEHLLLRPKFPGDAVMNACPKANCKQGGMEDPYSFRVTYLLPANEGPFSKNMDLRRYAERLIRGETPAHLLPKLCWISDEKGWPEYSDDELEDALEQCICPPTDPRFFRQLSRFESAWKTWLNANRDFDWADELDELETVTLSRLPEAVADDQMRQLLGYFGEVFHDYLVGQVATQDDPPVADDWMAAVWPQFLTDLATIRENADPGNDLYDDLELNDELLDELRDVWKACYTKYLPVSFRLHQLLGVFQQLRSAYPPATLHDSDDGDDENPIRLDHTHLGNL